MKREHKEHKATANFWFAWIFPVWVDVSDEGSLAGNEWEGHNEIRVKCNRINWASGSGSLVFLLKILKTRKKKIKNNYFINAFSFLI